MTANPESTPNGTTVNPIDRYCPVCDVGPGVSCTTPLGYRMPGCHDARGE